MKRDKHATFAVLTALVSTLMTTLSAAPAAHAQGENQGQEAASAAEMVTDYLKQDIFLRPGVGLKKVRLGMSFKQVQQTWGKPTRTRRQVFGENQWVYEVGDHTRIALIGDDSVESMRLEGGVASPYTTTEGASFGMAQHQLATIYGSGEADSERVTYAKRGVGFGLDQGQVSEIRIFHPD